MAAGSPQPGEAEWFTAPEQVNQRRYEALRAYYVGGLSYAEAGKRFGYTRWSMINLVREHKAGKLELFAPAKKPGPPPGTAPARDRARVRAVELRLQGLSTYEISARLAAEGRPLNRTSVAEILAGKGSPVVRGPQPAQSISPATPGRDTGLPRAQVLDFAAWPERLDTTRAGLLLVLPDLVALDLPRWPRRPATPARAWSRRSAGCCRCWRSSHPQPPGIARGRPAADPAAGLPAAWPCCRRSPR